MTKFVESKDKKTKPFTINMDFRENNSGIYGEIVVEHKTTRDFVQ
ncbi:unnamed protein product, partial [marine sediment metagenome]